jgi:2-dehydro-3-deoxy-D-arabinonate dehydratase
MPFPKSTSAVPVNLSPKVERFMLLTRHKSENGHCWAADGRLLQKHFNLRMFLALENDKAIRLAAELLTYEQAETVLASPIEDEQEVWASGVTYLRSRDARKAESDTADLYEKVYSAERPELFPKAIGWRVIGDGEKIRVRSDSTWNVPEPEMTLVVNSRRQIVGYCIGNDVSSRSIEGENALYLPQAKIFSGSCALGPGIQIDDPASLRSMPVSIEIHRSGKLVFKGETNTSAITRPLDQLTEYLFKEMSFPEGVFLMTGTGIVPKDDFTLEIGDTVRICIGRLTLKNTVGE